MDGQKDGPKETIKLVVAILLAKHLKQSTRRHISELKASHLRIQSITSHNAESHNSEQKASYLRVQRFTNQNKRLLISEYKQSSFRRPNLHFHLYE